MPNVAIVGTDTLIKLRNHPAILERFKFTTPGGASLAMLQDLFEIPQIVEAPAVVVSAAGVASFAWGKHFVLAYVQDNPGPQDPSFGKTFLWSGAPGTTGGFSVEMGRLNPPSRKADEIAVHFYRGKKVTSNVSAYLIKNAVA
jgi:hypothetical protein